MADHRDAYLTLLKSVLLGMTQIETELRCFYLQDCLAGTRRYSYQQLFNIRPAMAINKEIDLRFVVGSGPLDFRDTHHLLADGKIDASPIVTGTVGLEGVASAFDALTGAEHHATIIGAQAQTARR